MLLPFYYQLPSQLHFLSATPVYTVYQESSYARELGYYCVV